MGWTRTRWEAGHDGHQIVVTRNELTKGFALEVDGVVVKRKRWSLAGQGKLDGTFRSGDREVSIAAELRLSMRKPVCVITVDGAEISVWNVD